MNSENLTISYFDDTDTLVFHTVESSGCGETIAPDLWVIYGQAGEVSSVTIDHAARMLGPYLFPADVQKRMGNWDSRDLKIVYTRETDTLVLQTGEPPYVWKTVAPGLCVNFDTEGWAMGVAISPAAVLLRPYLLAESAGVA